MSWEEERVGDDFSDGTEATARTVGIIHTMNRVQVTVESRDAMI